MWVDGDELDVPVGLEGEDCCGVILEVEAFHPVGEGGVDSGLGGVEDDRPRGVEGAQDVLDLGFVEHKVFL